MKLSIPSISFLQDGSVHHLYVSDRTILVHPNAEPLTAVVISLFSQQYCPTVGMQCYGVGFLSYIPT